MDAGRRHKRPGLKTKDITIEVVRVLEIAWQFPKLSHRVVWRGPDDTRTYTQWVEIQETNSQLREVESFLRGSKPTYPLLWRETIASLFMGPSLIFQDYANILEKRVQNKEQAMPCSQDNAESQETPGELSLNNRYYYQSYHTNKKTEAQDDATCSMSHDQVWILLCLIFAMWPCLIYATCGFYLLNMFTMSPFLPLSTLTLISDCVTSYLHHCTSF